MLRILRNTVMAAGIAMICGLSSACADAVDKPIPAAKLDEAKAGAPASESAPRARAVWRCVDARAAPRRPTKLKLTNCVS